MALSSDRAILYGPRYFRTSCGQPYERTPEWLGFFDGIAEAIISKIGPRTVLDAGCAMGFLVERLRERGVEAFGIDISDYALSQVRPDLKPYVRVGSLADPLSQRYDLVVCIEVLEHLQPQEGERAVHSLCDAADDILFSSTPTDYREATHFNVQPPDYWAGLFAECGLVRDVDFDASFITAWAARFRRNREPFHRVVRDYERRLWSLWKENRELRTSILERERQSAADETMAPAMTAGEAEKDRERAASVLTGQSGVRPFAPSTASRPEAMAHRGSALVHRLFRVISAPLRGKADR